MTFTTDSGTKSPPQNRKGFVVTTLVRFNDRAGNPLYARPVALAAPSTVAKLKIPGMKAPMAASATCAHLEASFPGISS